MEKSKNEILLNSIYQNTQTALQSLENIMPKVESDSLKSEFSNEEGEYTVILKECEMIGKSENINLKDNNCFEKLRLWSSINLSTMGDKTTSHIAEMFLIGTFMGIITCIKDENEHSGANEEIKSLLKKLKSLEERNLETLKTFL